MNHEPETNRKDDNFEEPFKPKDSSYMGNIWGWRNSMIGAVIILALFILILVRYCQVRPDTFYVRESMHIEKHPGK